MENSTPVGSEEITPTPSNPEILPTAIGPSSGSEDDIPFKKPDAPIDKILYYSEHPELKPPEMIKNMVFLHQQLKKMEEEGFVSEDGSDSSESSEESEPKESTRCSVHEHGVRFPNGYLVFPCLEHVEYAALCGPILHVTKDSGDQCTFTLPDDYDGNQVLAAMEKWTVRYRSVE